MIGNDAGVAFDTPTLSHVFGSVSRSDAVMWEQLNALATF
jgi:hypothetical protein